MQRCFMEGNEAVAWGAYDAGCRFFSGYPITPATSIFNTMLSLLPQAGGTVLQAEDEIAAMGYCLGASMAGLKVMTATSGPGISLYSEHISFAIGSEIPIVIVDVQRLGPSTGSATRGADGDIQFLRWGNSGGLPLIVLAPTDARDCYSLTRHAFNLAEHYRCPVVVASNKEIAQTRESVIWEQLERPGLVDREPPPEDAFHMPFRPLPGRDVPGFLPLGGTTPARQTSSTHGANGYITTDPNEIEATLERLKRKIETDVAQLSYYEAWTQQAAETLLITYGVTSRAARAVYEQLQDRKRPISVLVLKTLWPVPETVIREMGSRAKRVVVVEMNLGQYVREVERTLGREKVEFFGRMDGRLITPGEILEVIHG